MVAQDWYLWWTLLLLLLLCAQNSFPELMRYARIQVVEMLDHVLATYNPRAGEYTEKLWKREGECLPAGACHTVTRLVPFPHSLQPCSRHSIAGHALHSLLTAGPPALCCVLCCTCELCM